MKADELAAALRAEAWCRMASPTPDGVVVKAQLEAALQVEGEEETVAGVKAAMGKCFGAAVTGAFGEEPLPSELEAEAEPVEVITLCKNCLCYRHSQCRRGLPVVLVTGETRWPEPDPLQGCAEGVPR